MASESPKDLREHTRVMEGMSREIRTLSSVIEELNKSLIALHEKIDGNGGKSECDELGCSPGSPCRSESTGSGEPALV